MSHIATVTVQVKDLKALASACERLGLEFIEGQTTFKWFGQWVGDYNGDDAAFKELGIDPKTYGTCLHAIRVKGAADHVYEIGVIKHPNRDGYALLWDFWNGGCGLMKHVAAQDDKEKKGIGKLMQMYGLEAAKRSLAKQGMTCVEKVLENGAIKLVANVMSKLKR